MRDHETYHHIAYTSQNITGVKRWRRITSAVHVGRMEEMRNANKVLFVKHEGKILLGRKMRS